MVTELDLQTAYQWRIKCADGRVVEQGEWPNDKLADIPGAQNIFLVPNPAVTLSAPVGSPESRAYGAEPSPHMHAIPVGAIPVYCVRIIETDGAASQMKSVNICIGHEQHGVRHVLAVDPATHAVTTWTETT